jgi:peroxiredoxin
MAPELELPSVEGSIVRLSDCRGSPVLVSFLSYAA